jgi:hypothetical protein
MPSEGYIHWITHWIKLGRFFLMFVVCSEDTDGQFAPEVIATNFPMGPPTPLGLSNQVATVDNRLSFDV